MALIFGKKREVPYHACLVLSMLFVPNLFSVSSFDFKDVTVSERSVYAQEPIKDNETSRVPLVGVNMRGYYTNIPQERDFKVPIPPNYYEQASKPFHNQVLILRVISFSGNRMKEIPSRS